MGQKIKDQNAEKEFVNHNVAGSCEGVDEMAPDSVTDDRVDGADTGTEVADEAEMWKDRYIRLSAEFDNYRKRTLKEKMELIQTGGEDVVKSVLGVTDDFDRAMQAMEKTDDVDSVREGVKLISQKLYDVLRQKGVVEIEAIGCELDTDLHDAVAKFPVEDPCKKGKIIDVVQKGYKMNDKVIRFAKVVVGE